MGNALRRTIAQLRVHWVRGYRAMCGDLSLSELTVGQMGQHIQMTRMILMTN